MELENSGNGDDCWDGEGFDSVTEQPIDYCDDGDSACSTPYVSAPSSPGRSLLGGGGYYYSAPSSPVRLVLCSGPFSPPAAAGGREANSSPESFEFEFSSRCPSPGSGGVAAALMSSADELFFNGQIRPMKLSTHLQRPQLLEPLPDVEGEGENRDCRRRDLWLRSRSVHRRSRSMTPVRSTRFEWAGEDAAQKVDGADIPDRKASEGEEDAATRSSESASASASASSSRSSSSGRNSKRWIFLKDLLFRSKSEGRERDCGHAKEKFWHSISFSPSSPRDRHKPLAPAAAAAAATAASVSTPHHPAAAKQKATSALTAATLQPNRRPPARSAHERHYAANRAQAEEMRRRTFLPYRQGLLGCLGFTSGSYGAMNGLAKTLNPVT